MSYRSIAIDGPSGAGKSTLARMLAQELGFLYVTPGPFTGPSVWRCSAGAGTPATPPRCSRC